MGETWKSSKKQCSLEIEKNWIDKKKELGPISGYLSLIYQVTRRHILNAVNFMLPAVRTLCLIKAPSSPRAWNVLGLSQDIENSWDCTEKSRQLKARLRAKNL
jgi:hypothetical protein